MLPVEKTIATVYQQGGSLMSRTSSHRRHVDAKWGEHDRSAVFLTIVYNQLQASLDNKLYKESN